MTIQFIKDEEGKKQYVVIPYGEYFRMRLAMLEYDDDDENDWEDTVSYTHLDVYKRQIGPLAKGIPGAPDSVDFPFRILGEDRPHLVSGVALHIG